MNKLSDDEVVKLIRTECKMHPMCTECIFSKDDKCIAATRKPFDYRISEELMTACITLSKKYSCITYVPEPELMPELTLKEGLDLIAAECIKHEMCLKAIGSLKCMFSTSTGCLATLAHKDTSKVEDVLRVCNRLRYKNSMIKKTYLEDYASRTKEDYKTIVACYCVDNRYNGVIGAKCNQLTCEKCWNQQMPVTYLSDFMPKIKEQYSNITANDVYLNYCVSTHYPSTSSGDEEEDRYKMCTTVDECEECWNRVIPVKEDK